MASESIDNVTLHLYYGEEFFETLKNGITAWSEFTDNLRNYKHNKANIDVEIPDFGTSEEILNELINLPNKYWNKLMSNREAYVELREELFSSGDNLEKAKKIRK